MLIGNIGNKLLKRILIAISYFPLSFLYVISTGLYVLLYRIIGYRKKVIFNNLKIAFPGKPDSFYNQIAKKYYRYLADLIVESVKAHNASKKLLRKHIRFNETELYDELFKDGKSAIVVMGHCGNWEWVCRSAPLFVKSKVLVAYKPLTNKEMDKFMLESRSAFGSKLIPMSGIAREIAGSKEPFLLILLGDQSPASLNGSFICDLFGKKTAVLPGIEKLANKFKLPVIYADICISKRGKYNVSSKLISENEYNQNPGSLSQVHTHYLERAVKEHPENWLWSHRRWKLTENL